MTPGNVLDVGNCDPDHAAIRRLLVSNFDAELDRVMFVDDALRRMSATTYDLVLVNRRIFADDSDGLALITAMKADPRLAGTPVLMISNYPEAQQRAIAAGAAPGFGKAALNAAATLEILARYLPRKSVSDLSKSGRV